MYNLIYFHSQDELRKLSNILSTRFELIEWSHIDAISTLLMIQVYYGIDPTETILDRVLQKRLKAA